MIPTDDEEVFQVMEVEPIDENTWLVRGRNYKDIHIGQILFAYLANDELTTAPFEVVKIRAFGKNLSEISYGYASEIIVTGERGKELKQIKHLYAR